MQGFCGGVGDSCGLVTKVAKVVLGREALVVEVMVVFTTTFFLVMLLKVAEVAAVMVMVLLPQFPRLLWGSKLR